MNAQHQLIHDYLDGTIEPYMEEMLFSQLSAHEDMRREFAAQMTLQKSAAADMRTIVAPDDAKRAVLTQIGLLPTTSTADIATKATALSVWRWLASRMVVVSGIAAIALLLGGTAVWYGYEYAGWAAKEQGQNLAGTPSASSVQQVPSSSSQTPSSTNTPEPVVRWLSSAPQRIYVVDAEEQNPTVSANPALTPSQNSSEQENEGVSATALSSSPYMSAAVNTLMTTNTETELPHLRQQIEAQTIPAFADNTWSLSLRGSNSLSQIPSVENTAFANGALSALYTINESQALGLEFSNEYYNFTETRRVAGRDAQVNYAEVMPAFGIVYRYSLQGLSFMNITPFGQMFVGGTTTGNGLGRAALGVEWSPERRVGFVLGMDAAAMPYRVQGTWKTSFKPSLLYGVQVRF